MKVVDAGGEHAKDKVADATGGVGADVVIEAAGVAQAFGDALHYVRDRGCIIVLGYHTAPVQFVPGEEFYHKELDIRATRAIGPHPGLPLPYVQWTSDRSLKLAVDLLASGRLQTSGMITHRFHCTEARDAYALIDQQREDFLQVLLFWGGHLDR